MSHVELVAIFTTVLRKYKVEVVIEDGESEDEARNRGKSVLKDSQNRLTLQMNRPNDVKLIFVERV